MSTVLKAPVFYLRDKLSARQFFILSSILVGLASGLAAIILKYFVHTIGTFANFYSTNYKEFFLFALFPLIGIALTVMFVRYVMKRNPEKGSAVIKYAIIKESSDLPASNIYGHMVTSALTIGFGGSCGLESPIVSTGAAIGSNYSKVHALSYKDRTILLACGASAGIAAAFNAPIAGVLFAIEVLLADITASAFIPLIIAAASGALLSKVILKEGVIISFSLQQPFNSQNVLFYVVLGVLAGFVSLYYARAFKWIESRMASLRNAWWRIITGGLILFVMILVFPPLFGEGYESIKILASLKAEELTKTSILIDALHSEVNILLFLGCLIFLKAIAAAITLGSGGNGGSFAPSLFVGAYLGFVFSRLVNLSGLASIPENNFTLVAMAGILSGVFYAPLTAIFLIAEITGGYGLIIPLMIVSALSVTVAHIFEPQSPESKKLAARLNISLDSRDSLLASRLDLTQMIETDFSVVKPDDTLRNLIQLVANSRRNIFPVVNETRELVGIIYLDDIRSMIFNTSNPEKVSVRQLMVRPSTLIFTDENLVSVLQKFDDTQQWNLPVVTLKKEYLGFISKSNLFAQYRGELLKTS